SGESRLRREPKNLLSPSTGCRSGHHHHDSSRLSIYAPVDSSDGSFDHKWALSLRARFAHPRRRRTARRHALVEIRCKPVSDPRGEFSHWSETLRVSHWLSRVFASAIEASAVADELRRFCVR